MPGESIRSYKQDSYISNGRYLAHMYKFPAKIPSTVAERTLTSGVGATLTFTAAMGGVPFGINGSDSGHYLYISGGSGTAEAVLITGGTAVSGAASGTITFTPTNSHSGTWNIQSATGGIQEAICDMPATGGIVDAMGLSSINIYANLFPGVSAKVGRVKMGSYTLTVLKPTIVPNGWHLEGLGTGVTFIKASASIAFDAFNAVIEGGTVGGSENCLVSNMTIDCNTVANSVGYYSNTGNEQSGLSYVNIINAATYGVNIEKSGSIQVPQNFTLDHVNINMNPAATAGIRIAGGSSALCVYGIRSTTIVNMGTSGTVMTAGISLDNVIGGSFDGIHIENATDGILIGASNACSNLSFSGISGPTAAATVTNLVHISNATTSSTCSFQAIIKGQSSTTLKDDGAFDSSRGAATLSGGLGLYAFGAGNPQPVLSTDGAAANQITLGSVSGGPTFLGGVTFNGTLNPQLGALTLSTGANHNITLPSTTYVRVTGPSGAFNITGFAFVQAGRLVILYNATTQAMTITDNSSSSTAGNRIRTLTGADVTLRSGTSMATFIYDSVQTSWVLVSTN